MSKSPLNHKQRGGIAGLASGLFGRKNRGNSNQNDPNALNNVRSLAKKGGIFGAMGKLALQQQGTSGAVNNADAMQNEALNSVENTGVVNPIDIQKNQVAQASGLTALTEGPTNAGSSIIPQKQGTLADQQYNSILGGLGTQTAFANKSPLKLAEVESKDFSEYNQAYAQGGYQGIGRVDDDGDGVSNDTENTIEATQSVGQAVGDIISSAQNNKGKEKTTRKQRLQSKIDSTDNPAKKERMQGRLDRINMRQEGRAARGKKKNELKGKFVKGVQDFKNKLWGVDNENSSVEVKNPDLLNNVGLSRIKSETAKIGVGNKREASNNINNSVNTVYGENYQNKESFFNKYGGGPNQGVKDTYNSEMKALQNEWNAANEAWGKGEGPEMTDNDVSKRIAELDKKYNKE